MHQLTLADSRIKMTEQRQFVLEVISSCGRLGATDQEIQNCLSWSGDTERPRRGELVTAGRIKDSGRKRPTPLGGQATVWVVS